MKTTTKAEKILSKKLWEQALQFRTKDKNEKEHFRSFKSCFPDTIKAIVSAMIEYKKS